MWKYVGPHLDPHRHVYVAGMLRAVHDKSADQLDAAVAANLGGGLPLDNTVGLLYRLDEQHSAVIFRRDGAACGFIVRDNGEMTGSEIIDKSRAVFPEVWARLPMIRVEKDEPACQEPSSLPPRSPAPSPSSTSRTERPSKRTKP